MRRSLLVAGVMALCLIFLATGVVSAKAKWTKELGMKCTECHDQMKDKKTSALEPHKIASNMDKMTTDINGQLKTAVKMNCYGCHRGAAKIAKADDKVEGATSPEMDKAMKELTESINKTHKDCLKGATVSCATCHHGKGKVPEKP